MYKDRGIIKWAPFDSLTGFNERLNELKYQIGKNEKPVLSEDQLYLIDLTIKEAINDNKEIAIEYYEDGYIKTMYGYVKNVNLIYKNVILHGKIEIPISIINNIHIV